MDLRFNENEQMLADLCSRFAKEQLAEAGAEADRNGATPPELIAKGMELGLFLDAIPEDDGGYSDGEYSQTERVVRVLNLATGCPAVTLRYEANTEFVLATLGLDGTPAAAARKALADNPGETLGCTVLSTDRAPILFEGGTLDGRAGAVPNAIGAANYVVVSLDNEANPFVALVPAGQVQIEPSRATGMMAAAVGDVVLTGAKPDAVIEGDEARKLVRTIRNSYRLLAGSLGVGAALQAIDYAADYAEERVQFGQPIARFESMARLVHENRGRLLAAKHLLLAAAQSVDHGEPADDLCRYASDVAGEAATRAAIDAVQIYGGYGFVNDYPVEKIMRDVRACTTLAGDGLREQVLAQAGSGQA